ncbi:amidohydrolase family protein [Novosphingobium aquimarinum]|uniref:amidohydrolase family protein n=1 Tax=Novosphingobium aquimarinum TaxID=2682494 RepID=UPI0012EC7743|nr:amidohydrolase family protein [Novosphingobium aquimarinum]
MPGDFPIVDAQIHKPSPPVGLPDSFGDENALVLSVELAREAMDSVGVDAALLVADNAYIDACVARYPGRFAGVQVFQQCGEDLDHAIRAAADDPAIVAGRFMVTDFRNLELVDAFVEGAMEAGFAAASDVGLPLFLSTHGQAAAMEPVLQRYPDLAIIIDHLGVSQHPVSPPRDDPWDRLGGLLVLAKYPRVHVKICGLPLLSVEEWPHADTMLKLRQLIEAFGVERLMWASDYTRLRLAKTGESLRNRGRLYSETRDMILHGETLSDAEKAALLGESCMKLVDWRPSP